MSHHTSPPPDEYYEEYDSETSEPDHYQGSNEDLNDFVPQVSPL